MNNITGDRHLDENFPRRFLKGGIYRVLANDIKLWWLDLLGIDLEEHADNYWQENIRRG